MRRVLSLLVLGLISLLVGPLSADKVVLKDGRTLDTKKPPIVKGRQAVLTLADGKLVSIPASEIDTEKTAALARKAAEAAKVTPAPTPLTAPSLVEAARAGQNAKKATVVLTDQDVAGGYLEVSSGSPEKGEGEVSMGPVTTKKVATGWEIEGSVLNSGKAPVVGVTVTIEALGEKGKSIASTFAALAKDLLEPGEKATFRAQVDTDQTVERFTYVPRWKIVAPPPTEGEAAGDKAAAEGEKKKGDDAGEGGATPTPAPTPAPQPTPAPPPPGWAAPQANAPVGSPSQPGGTYLPPPSSNQPKPPGGGR
jgi:hypothetical protein